MKTKRIAFLFALFISATVTSYSQDYFGDVDVKAIKNLKSHTLLVVVDSPESELGKALINAFKKYWDFNSYKFIKTSDVRNNINKDVPFFVFEATGEYTKSQDLVTGRHSPPSNNVDPDPIYGIGALMLFGPKTQSYIAIDPNLIPGKYYYNNRAIFKEANCGFTIFMGGGKDTKQSDDGLISGVKTVDYVIPCQPQTGIYVNGLWKSITQYDPYKPLYAYEIKAIPYLPFFIERLNKHLQYVYAHDDNPKTKKENAKLLFSADGDKGSETAKLMGYDDALSNIQNMTILIDSSITDELGVKILAKSLNISETQINLVPWNKILAAIDNKDPNVAILYYHHLDYTADPLIYAFWATDGTRLFNFNFRHIAQEKSYGFGFRKDDTEKDLERSQIQFTK